MVENDDPEQVLRGDPVPDPAWRAVAINWSTGRIHYQHDGPIPPGWGKIPPGIEGRLSPNRAETDYTRPTFGLNSWFYLLDDGCHVRIQGRPDTGSAAVSILEAFTPEPAPLVRTRPRPSERKAPAVWTPPEPVAPPLPPPVEPRQPSAVEIAAMQEHLRLFGGKVLTVDEEAAKEAREAQREALRALAPLEALPPLAALEPINQGE